MLKNQLVSYQGKVYKSVFLCRSWIRAFSTNTTHQYTNRLKIGLWSTFPNYRYTGCAKYYLSSQGIKLSLITLEFSSWDTVGDGCVWCAGCWALCGSHLAPLALIRSVTAIDVRHSLDSEKLVLLNGWLLVYVLCADTTSSTLGKVFQVIPWHGLISPLYGRHVLQGTVNCGWAGCPSMYHVAAPVCAPACSSFVILVLYPQWIRASACREA